MIRKYMIYEVRYNKDRDAYETWLAVTEGYYPKKEDFGLELSCPCVSAQGSKTKDGMTIDTPEPVFVHFSILQAIAKAYHLGYEIDYRI